jgi:hypothetical protein
MNKRSVVVERTGRRGSVPISRHDDLTMRTLTGDSLDVHGHRLRSLGTSTSEVANYTGRVGDTLERETFVWEGFFECVPEGRT